MSDRTLSEKLEMSTLDAPYRASSQDNSVLLESVLENIRRILNERRGSCEIRLDFGMPDLNDILGQGGNPSSLAAIVQKTIEMFEPRLTNAVVRPVPLPDEPTAVQFRVTAFLKAGNDREAVAFDTVVSDDKRVRVRG